MSLFAECYCGHSHGGISPSDECPDCDCTNYREDGRPRRELLEEIKRLHLCIDADPLTLIEGAWQMRDGVWVWEPTNRDHQIWCTVIDDEGSFEVECSDGIWTYKDDHLYTADIDLEAAKEFAVRMLIQICNAHAGAVRHAR